MRTSTNCRHASCLFLTEDVRLLTRIAIILVASSLATQLRPGASWTFFHGAGVLLGSAAFLLSRWVIHHREKHHREHGRIEYRPHSSS